MDDNDKDIQNDIISALDAENLFGKKLFYRQKIYRLEKAGKVKGFTYKGQKLFLGSQILKAVIMDLVNKIEARFPAVDGSLRITYSYVTKEMTVDGIGEPGVTICSDLDNEEEILNKVGDIVEPQLSDDSFGELDESEKVVPIEDEMLLNILPEELVWVRLDVKELVGVEVKSMVLMSLSTVAQYMGVDSYRFSQWVQGSPYEGYVLSVHPKQIDAPGKPGAWKRGVTNGYTPFIPFELLPEVLVAFRSSNVKAKYPARAEQLYQLASNTLRVVGLVVAGDKEDAATALAEVGQGLGLDVADQIIGVMKQYATRSYQVQTQKEFSSKVKQLNADYGAVTGKLTFGITDKTAIQWRREGVKQGLTKTQSSSAREVMRRISPSDGVGMTFGEKVFIKQSKTDEAVRTGREGKQFYERLKSVGLLEDTDTGSKPKTVE